MSTKREREHEINSIDSPFSAIYKSSHAHYLTHMHAHTHRYVHKEIMLMKYWFLDDWNGVAWLYVGVQTQRGYKLMSIMFTQFYLLLPVYCGWSVIIWLSCNIQTPPVNWRDKTLHGFLILLSFQLPTPQQDTDIIYMSEIFVGKSLQQRETFKEPFKGLLYTFIVSHIVPCVIQQSVGAFRKKLQKTLHWEDASKLSLSHVLKNISPQWQQRFSFVAELQ